MSDETSGSNQEPRRHGPGAGLWVGVSFVALGILLILQTSGLVHLNNWWALFLLIPALATFGSAWSRARQNGGRFTRSVSGPISGGLFISAVAILFLFNLDWGKYWPVFIVLAGLSTLLGAFARRD